MKEAKPRFILTRVYEDGTQEDPQVVPLKQVIRDAKMNRRGFLGVGLTATAAVIWLSGCDPKNEPEPKPAEPELPNSAPVEEAIDCDRTFAHAHRVESLAINPDGKWLYSVDNEGYIKIWSLPEGAFTKTFAGHKVSENFIRGVASLIANPNGKSFFSSGRDGTINIWSAPEVTLVKIITEKNSVITSLVVTPDGRYLISSGIFGTENIIIWNLPDGTLYKSFYNDDVRALAITPDGSQLFLCNYDGEISLWSIPDIKLINTWKEKNSYITSLAITPDGKWLLSGDSTGTIKMRDLSNGIVKKEIISENKTALTLAITPDGSQLLSSNIDDIGDCYIKLWSLPDLVLKKTVMQKDYISALRVSPDSKILISCSNDKTIKIWKLPDLTFVSCLLDLGCVENTVEGITYDVIDESGRTITYTLPCGSPLPANAKCTCNCVPGKICTAHIPPCACNIYNICYFCSCAPVYR